MTPDPETTGKQAADTVRHLFEIAAPPQVVFDAVTTAEGLAGWWTTTVRAQPAAMGGRIEFGFHDPFNPIMQIREYDPARAVEWQGVGGHDPFGAQTTIRFELEAIEDRTRVRFHHILGREVGPDAVASANSSWGYYLNSLRQLCETGTGTPLQPDNPRTRVGADPLN